MTARRPLSVRGGDQSRGKADGHQILGEPPRETEGRSWAGSPRSAAHQRAGDGARDTGQGTGLGRSVAPGEHPATNGADREPNRE
ncbi:hypothetical protein ASF53_06225 [Methylobacterium sp. Leaf123]|nr:hypothetical protein ASF53_06225 [Methylobacterium sp. Leaf123]